MSIDPSSTDRYDVESLSLQAVDSKPINVDSWADLAGENLEGFTSYEASPVYIDGVEHTVICEGSSVAAVLLDGKAYTDWSDYADDWRDAHDSEEDPDGEDSSMSESTFEDLMDSYGESAEGPMMNYWYPVALDSSGLVEAAAEIADLPLCVVEVGGETGLALTGGGMDLSWQIAEAFVRLGFLPPAHFADLPHMAGETPNQRVLAAMRRSLTCQMNWAASALDRLKSFDTPSQ